MRRGAAAPLLIGNSTVICNKRETSLTFTRARSQSYSHTKISSNLEPRNEKANDIHEANWNGFQMKDSQSQPVGK
jgi:hypothetical protein